MKTALQVDENQNEGRAIGVLNRSGVFQEDFLPSLWDTFKLHVVQLLHDGYKEPHIQFKLEERAISLARAKQEQTLTKGVKRGKN